MTDHSRPSVLPGQKTLKVAGPFAFLQGVNAADLLDAKVHLPESVEEQTEKILSNMDKLLSETRFDRGNIVSIRISLVRFDVLHERMFHRLQRCLGNLNSPAISCVGVSMLVREALIEMDFVISAE